MSQQVSGHCCGLHERSIVLGRSCTLFNDWFTLCQGRQLSLRKLLILAHKTPRHYLGLHLKRLYCNKPEAPCSLSRLHALECGVLWVLVWGSLGFSQDSQLFAAHFGPVGLGAWARWDFTVQELALAGHDLHRRCFAFASSSEI